MTRGNSLAKAHSTKAIWLLAGATMLTSGIMYYVQPLLEEISRTFATTAAAIGSIPSFSQIGYVAGLLLVTPLGDVMDKRRLIIALLALAALALGVAGLAPSFTVFACASAAIGLAGVVVQVQIPFVALLSPIEERANNLGTVLSAALIGILLSRTFSGYLGHQFGWRVVYLVAAAMMVVLLVALWRSLPEDQATTSARYPTLIASVWTLFRSLPKLRQIALVGALMYAALCSFWTPLAFFLLKQYGWGPSAAGSFGLLGATGALAAKLVQRPIERLGPRRVVRWCAMLMLSSFAVMGIFAGQILGLIAGVVLLDLGAQAATVANQTELYQLHSSAHTRLNTIYKMHYFIGGAAGSYASALAWQHAGWNGVCWTGAFFLGAAMLIEARTNA